MTSRLSLRRAVRSSTGWQSGRMRTGAVQRAWDEFVGPLGRLESTVVLAAASAGAVRVGVDTARRTTPARGLFLGAIAFDLIGGLIAFQLKPTRERYARSSFRSRLTFALLHLQPFAVPLAGEGSWKRAAFRYALSVASTLALETMRPQGLSRRRHANALAVSLSIVDVTRTASKQRWLGPVYLMKVIGGHGGIGGPLSRA